jgi:diguanylate cyclase (GGDEF)-like protein
LKRIPIGYLELLRDVLPREALLPEEAAALERALASTSPSERKRTAQQLVLDLIQRGALEVLEAEPTARGRSLRLRDRLTRVRFRIHLDDPGDPTTADVIPLPMDPPASAQVAIDVVQILTVELARLVMTDRVAGPREILLRAEPAIASALGARSVVVAPVAFPPGEFWRSTPPEPFPIPEARLRDLARDRSYLLLLRDLSQIPPAPGARPREGSALYVGIGDARSGWHAAVEIYDEQPDAFPRERIALAVLVAGHLQTLLSNTVRLQSFMFFDYVTGLYNRAYFEDQLEKVASMALRHGESFALCIVDIDDFKKFNTLYGYEGGDRVLTTVGQVLKAALRGSDTLARYGGEEFGVILAPPMTGEEAHVIAERLRIAVEIEPFQVQGLSGELVKETITVSVGGALYPNEGPGVREIWTAANRMLLEAKAMGKNRVRFPGDPPPTAR